MSKQPTQADNTIHEDQLLNFLVNTLTGAFGVTLGENAEIDLTDIYGVLVGATADGTSISTLCDRSEDSPSGNDILYHLDTKFDLSTVKAGVFSADSFDPEGPVVNDFIRSRSGGGSGGRVALTHVAVDAPVLHLVGASQASNEMKFKTGAELSKSVN